MNDKPPVRLNPQLLRTGRRPALLGTFGPNEAKSGEALLLGILAASGGLVEKRGSFWESMSEYNPLGQFFAAHATRDR